MADLYNQTNAAMQHQRSDDLLYQIRLIVYRFVLPCVNLLGMFLTTASMAIFSQKAMRSSLNTYLAGLSLFDFTTLLTASVIYPPMTYCERPEYTATDVCTIFWPTLLLTYPLSLMAQTASVWTCVAITFDRFFAIKYPLRSRHWCTVGRAIRVLIGITAMTMLCRIPTLFELRSNPNGTGVAKTALRNNKEYHLIYHVYFYMTFLFLIPWAIMIALNVIVTHSVHRAYSMRRKMVANSNMNDEKETRCSLIAATIVVVFVVLNSLAVINNVMEHFTDITIDATLKSVAINLGNTMVCLNATANFSIYCALNKRFRRAFVYLLFCTGNLVFCCRRWTSDSGEPYAFSRFLADGGAAGAGGYAMGGGAAGGNSTVLTALKGGGRRSTTPVLGRMHSNITLQQNNHSNSITTATTGHRRSNDSVDLPLRLKHSPRFTRRQPTDISSEPSQFSLNLIQDYKQSPFSASPTHLPMLEEIAKVTNL